MRTDWDNINKENNKPIINKEKINLERGSSLSMIDICGIYQNYIEDLNDFLNKSITVFNNEIKKQLPSEVIPLNLIVEIDLKEGTIKQ